MATRPHHFRLERVRALRERSEDQAKQALADSLAQAQVADQNVDAAAGRIDAARSALSGAAFGITDAAVIRARQVYLEATEAHHRASVDVASGKAREVESTRAALVEAARARQSMDRLRERSLAAHQLASGRAEQAALDEIALNIFRRRAA